ncbi:MAG: hypothetical protein NC394_02715 [Bacteroides sp.]|nr:hypothetical protein [Bacteroides sp.]
MSKRGGKSFNIAYCGIVVALSVIVMLLALIPSMTYVLPAVSGIFIWTISDQISKKWGVLSYAASALLCFLLIPEIEADLYYLFFFGYYPLAKDIVEKIKPRLLGAAVKFLIFNAAVVTVFNILSHIMNLEQILEGLEGFGDMAVYVLWGAANIAFLFYDLCLNHLFYAFRKWIKPRINGKLKKTF